MSLDCAEAGWLNDRRPLVLFWVFGSSAAGKTALVAALQRRVRGLEVHNFDEIGVPSPATVQWRHRANELWLAQALAFGEAGMDLLVAGQTPIGELLASPSAVRVGALAACLLDCDDETRVARIEARGPGWFDRAGGTMHDYLAWGQWMRHHASDPTYRLDVIRTDGDGLEWGRLERWRANDPGWRVRVVDTARPIDSTRAEVGRWVADERARVAAGQRPQWFDADEGQDRASQPDPNDEPLD